MVDLNNDQRFMAAAIRLAKRHIGQTADNPSVGAIIVGSDGTTIVGYGVTAFGGRPHAETQALAMAGVRAKGGTAYVTLEPCSHYGKTPPCANALISSGVKRVVVARLDPDLRVSGRGVNMLRQANICVEVGILADAAFEGLSGYLTAKMQSRAQLTLKMAVSADNGIGMRGRGNVRISNDISHAVSHILRTEHDAIMVGNRTVIVDNPQLTCRLPGLENRSPLRIVIDRNLSIPLHCHLVKTAKIIPTWVFASKDAQNARQKELEENGVRIIRISTRQDILPPQDILAILCQNGISSVLLEGGTTTAQSFFADRAVDKVILFHSPVCLGDGKVPAPDFEKYLADFSQINKAKFAKDDYSEWRYRR